PVRGPTPPNGTTPPASTRQRQPPSHRATTELVCGLPVPRSAVTGGASSRYADGPRGPRGRDLHGRDRRGGPPAARTGRPAHGGRPGHLRWPAVPARAARSRSNSSPPPAGGAPPQPPFPGSAPGGRPPPPPRPPP